MDRTVLVVEDDRELSAALTDALQELGYRTHCAPDGVEALGWLRRDATPPAAIVLDLLMPRMDGVEFLKLRKSDPALARIPVIVLSGAAPMTESARELDADAILEKPVHLLMLIDAIRRIEPIGPGRSGGAWPRWPETVS